MERVKRRRLNLNESSGLRPACYQDTALPRDTDIAEAGLRGLLTTAELDRAGHEQSQFDQDRRDVRGQTHSEIRNQDSHHGNVTSQIDGPLPLPESRNMDAWAGSLALGNALDEQTLPLPQLGNMDAWTRNSTNGDALEDAEVGQ